MTNEGGGEKYFTKNKQTITKTMSTSIQLADTNQADFHQDNEFAEEDHNGSPEVFEEEEEETEDRDNTIVLDRKDETKNIPEESENCGGGTSIDFACYSRRQNSKSASQLITNNKKQSGYGSLTAAHGTRTVRNPTLKGNTEACSVMKTCPNTTDDYLEQPDIKTLSEFNENVNNVAAQVIQAHYAKGACREVSKDCNKSCSAMGSRAECIKNKHQCRFEDKLVCLERIVTEPVCIDDKNQKVTLKNNETCTKKKRYEDTLKSCQGHVCRGVNGNKIPAKDKDDCTKSKGTYEEEYDPLCNIDSRCTKISHKDGTNEKSLETVVTLTAENLKRIKRKETTKCVTFDNNEEMECPTTKESAAWKNISKITRYDGNPFNRSVRTRKSATDPFSVETMEDISDYNFGTCKYIDDMNTLEMASNCCDKNSQLSSDVTKKKNVDEANRNKQRVIRREEAPLFPTRMPMEQISRQQMEDEQFPRPSQLHSL